MKLLTEKMIEVAEAGKRSVLCTVLASSGSAPRGAGARMLVCEDGAVLGTVGGGRVEQLAQLEAREILAGGPTRIHAFCLAPNQVNSIGMICGGNVTIYFQLMTPDDLPTLYAMRDALSKDADSWLYLRIADGVVEEFRVVLSNEGYANPELYGARAVLEKGEPTVYTEPLMQAGRVIIFGGGHVGQALAPVLATIDFRVTVYDARPELANREHFPTAKEILCAPFSEAMERVKLKPSDYVVIMTPGHQSDRELLAMVLRHKTRYVGCIGSRHKIARTQELLRAEGLSEEAIRSVHSPIGIPLPAQTPAEIAISIAAELIQCRAETR